MDQKTNDYILLLASSPHTNVLGKGYEKEEKKGKRIIANGKCD